MNIYIYIYIFISRFFHKSTLATQQSYKELVLKFYGFILQIYLEYTHTRTHTHTYYYQYSKRDSSEGFQVVLTEVGKQNPKRTVAKSEIYIKIQKHSFLRPGTIYNLPLIQHCKSAVKKNKTLKTWLPFFHTNFKINSKTGLPISTEIKRRKTR